jgi:hypothetical protein
MSELDPRARKIIEQALSADGPGKKERERVRSRLIARLGAAALAGGAAATAAGEVSAAVAGTVATTASTPPAAAGAAAASTAGSAVSTGSTAAVTAAGGAALGAAGATGAGTAVSAGLVTKLALAVAVAGAIGVGVANTALKKSGDFAEEKSPSPGDVRTDQRPAGAVEQPAGTRTAGQQLEETEKETSISGPVLERSAKPASTRAPRDTRNKVARYRLDQELALLRAAQDALQRGEPRQALLALERHSRRFPRGAMRQEREAARAVSLCELGRVKEGRKVARRVLSRSPRSPLAQRMARSCSFDPLGGGGR